MCPAVLNGQLSANFTGALLSLCYVIWGAGLPVSLRRPLPSFTDLGGWEWDSEAGNEHCSHPGVQYSYRVQTILNFHFYEY